MSSYAVDYNRRSRPDDRPAYKWAVVYQHINYNDRVESRHYTRAAAEKAQRKLQRDFDRWNPRSGGVVYLCGYSVVSLDA